MKTRLTALALATLMFLGLTACGPKENVDAAPSEGPTASQDAADPKSSPDIIAPSAEVEASVEPSGSAASSETPSTEPTPELMVDPTAPPSEEAVDESEPTRDLSAKDIYTMWTASSSAMPAPGSDFVDMGSVMENFYNVDAADLDDFYFAMPDMSGDIQELFIAKAKSGKTDSVKAACQSRWDGLKEDAEFYPDTATYMDAAQLKASGDWVLFYVGPDASRVAKIFSDCTK